MNHIFRWTRDGLLLIFFAVIVVGPLITADGLLPVQVVTATSSVSA